MEDYVQLRWLCAGPRGCGEYQQWCYPESEPERGTCPKCGRKTTIRLARCTGKVTWFEPYSTRPKKKTHDWVRGGKKNNAKSSGRPKKKPLDNSPYVARIPVTTEVI